MTIDEEASWTLPKPEPHPMARIVAEAKGLDMDAAPCKRCNGRGYIAEDVNPDCPAIGSPEHECKACEGSGVDAEGTEEK